MYDSPSIRGKQYSLRSTGTIGTARRSVIRGNQYRQRSTWTIGTVRRSVCSRQPVPSKNYPGLLELYDGPSIRGNQYRLRSTLVYWNCTTVRLFAATSTVSEVPWTIGTVRRSVYSRQPVPSTKYPGLLELYDWPSVCGQPVPFKKYLNS